MPASVPCRPQVGAGQVTWAWGLLEGGGVLELGDANCGVAIPRFEVWLWLAENWGSVSGLSSRLASVCPNLPCIFAWSACGHRSNLLTRWAHTYILCWGLRPKLSATGRSHLQFQRSKVKSLPSAWYALIIYQLSLAPNPSHKVLVSICGGC